MKAMVLCAGFGTRLRPLTDRVPKPLVPVCGVPLLKYNLALLKNAGVREIVVNVHHLAAEMEKGAIQIAREVGLELAVSRETGHILGTGGGVRRAAGLLGRGTFLLLNGDMLFDVDLEAAIAAHKSSAARATMRLPPLTRFKPDADPFAGTSEVAPGVRVHPTAQIDRSARLQGPALVCAGAVVGPGATIGPAAVLGTGVRVDAGGAVTRAVAWEGTHVAPGERVQDSVAAPGVRMES